MKKIMFNHKYGLHEAVINGTKYMTRRLSKEQPTYKVNEVVGLAMSYREIEQRLHIIHHEYANSIGYKNKLYVKADLMPYKLKILTVKTEWLQRITDVECIAEGIYYDYDIDGYKYKNSETIFDTPRMAFASLIDKISGEGTWKSNPLVDAYTFTFYKPHLIV